MQRSPHLCVCKSWRLCHVRLLDLYLQKLPPEAIEKDILFYVRSLEKILSDPTAPWYTAVPIGRYTLDKKVRVMCKNAGIFGHKDDIKDLQGMMWKYVL